MGARQRAWAKVQVLPHLQTQQPPRRQLFAPPEVAARLSSILSLSAALHKLHNMGKGTTRARILQLQPTATKVWL